MDHDTQFHEGCVDFSGALQASAGPSIAVKDAAHCVQYVHVKVSYTLRDGHFGLSTPGLDDIRASQGDT